MKMISAYVLNAGAILAFAHCFSTSGFQWTCLVGGVASGAALGLARLAGAEEEASRG